MRSPVFLRLAMVCGLLWGFACSDASGPGIRLEVAPDSVHLVRGDSIQLQVNAVDSDNHLVTGVAVAFESNDTTIVTVTNLGVVHAHGTFGRTIISVRGGGAVTEVPIEVTATPDHIIVTPADTAVPANGSVQYRATVVDVTGDTIHGVSAAWTVLDTTLVKITATGYATAKTKVGTTQIVASYGGAFGSTTFTVLDSMLAGRTRVPDAAYGAAISGNVAYVTQTNSSRILRANLPARQFGSNVSVGVTPTEIAFNATGSRAYVTNQYSNSVSVVNVTTNAVIDAISVGNRPFEIIVAPGDSILYVGKVDSVYGIRLATKAIIAQFAIPDVGNGMAIARDTLLYVSTHGGGTVVEFNLRTRTLGRTFAVGGVPQKIVVSPNGSELYIANESGYVQFWNLDTGLQIGSNLALPAAGYGMARRPSNGLLYVTSAGGYIYVIDPVSRTLLHSSIVGGSTRHVVFNANGSIGIVPNESGWVDFLK